MTPLPATLPLSLFACHSVATRLGSRRVRVALEDLWAALTPPLAPPHPATGAAVIYPLPHACALRISRTASAPYAAAAAAGATSPAAAASATAAAAAGVGAGSGVAQGATVSTTVTVGTGRVFLDLAGPCGASDGEEPVLLRALRSIAATLSTPAFTAFASSAATAKAARPTPVDAGAAATTTAAAVAPATPSPFTSPFAPAPAAMTDALVSVATPIAITVSELTLAVRMPRAAEPANSSTKMAATSTTVSTRALLLRLSFVSLRQFPQPSSLAMASALDSSASHNVTALSVGPLSAGWVALTTTVPPFVVSPTSREPTSYADTLMSVTARRMAFPRVLDWGGMTAVSSFSAAPRLRGTVVALPRLVTLGAVAGISMHVSPMEFAPLIASLFAVAASLPLLPPALIPPQNVSTASTSAPTHTTVPPLVDMAASDAFWVLAPSSINVGLAPISAGTGAHAAALSIPGAHVVSLPLLLPSPATHHIQTPQGPVPAAVIVAASAASSACITSLAPMLSRALQTLPFPRPPPTAPEATAAAGAVPPVGAVLRHVAFFQHNAALLHGPPPVFPRSLTLSQSPEQHQLQL